MPPLFLGLLAIEHGDFEKARSFLLDANRLAPLNPRVVLALVRVHLTLGERSDAAELAQRFQDSRPPSAEQFGLAVLLAEFGDHDDAAACSGRFGNNSRIPRPSG